MVFLILWWKFRFRISVSDFEIQILNFGSRTLKLKLWDRDLKMYISVFHYWNLDPKRWAQPISVGIFIKLGTLASATIGTCPRSGLRRWPSTTPPLISESKCSRVGAPPNQKGTGLNPAKKFNNFKYTKFVVLNTCITSNNDKKRQSGRF